MPSSADDWLSQARAYLRFQVDQGFSEIVLPGEAPQALPVRPGLTLESIREELGECTRCPLHEKRNTIVFGEGNPHARLMFIGEGPGADEDRQGRPFVGKAGQLLTRMIRAMTLERSDVYIANIVKCRPPGNRDPRPIEIETCFAFLEAQIEVVNPTAIVALGRIAACTLLGVHEPVTRLRGEFRDRRGIPVMPTYHPSFLLRAEADTPYKAEAWADLKNVMALLEIPVRGGGGNS